ncbi:UDP-N-acetylmuramoylalanyl-D-glutamate--2,6-diaminopimelate ligase /UDP-N-acetylmuramoyl-tripeptide--D-alanyl-D-alanine ligase [Sphaerotilus hippei]|uniref:Multifunctional fusion protein n=1 Tax=Sphaerotilus hippei TaxID=744406 RepID=A0A318H4G1_9BURK|nr:bifunctional UDP-N-acetylmuramoyl-L-alanyl-D-glutamate--2,6-diaminopimelate ligase MurE/UDP-N-acetylmuramoyl-tripeptide--D-alanyl-D-alanine ligase MurF [Sphaerotilus hippei]PXW96936.1 UDP-N-acetylmuramoylalanyl-D-glutamate--2,6-diaminopimelate ligase /UDP-N-acetylmuramoyl-tripeptide--D-alanyl-D-alanine ligase [Sphaerotilus hippei]
MAPLTTLHELPAVLDWLARQVPPTARLCIDSRQLRPGDVFVAWPGHAQDARRFVPAALADGASAALVEADGVQAHGLDDARILAVPGLKRLTGELAHHWYGRPSDRLKVIASTGTNGKTSTAWWMAQALSLTGLRCAVVGTLGIGEPPTAAHPQAAIVHTGLTTPDPVTLHRTLAQWPGEPLAACAVEASSIGLIEHRLAGVHIDVALFTNFTPDHLDFHGSMDAYWAAKRALFDWPGLQAAVINLDDAHGAALAAELQAAGSPAVWGYSMQGAPSARLSATDLRYDGDGLQFLLHEGGRRVEIRTRLIGDYNVANALAVLGGLRALGLSLDELPALAAQFTPVPGRMQRVSPPAAASVPGPEIVVDYAHTPDALDKALQALRPLARARGGELLCVFGCGGNRDPGKRPVMGALAVRLADRVVVTSDNPRLEPPAAIIEQIMAGATAVPAAERRAREVRQRPDRAVAIATTIATARDQDVILIAGKGHEDYQDMAGQKTRFSDVEQAELGLQARIAPPFMTLGQAMSLLASRLDGVQLAGDPALPLQRVHTDSRSVRAGDLFVALRGERFDAHDFLPQVQVAGASAALAERGLAEAGLAGLQVGDSLLGLQQLAAAWRAQQRLPVIAVTGSNGKTTVTQMLASILRAWHGEATHSTAGNLNNHIGVPLTVLGLRAGHRSSVVELGMNHPGEIAELAAIAQPTVALVNNAQREHQEFMKTVEAVARENASVFASLPADGVAVFPAGDPYSPLWTSLAAGRRCWRFALEDDGVAPAGPVEVRGRATWQGEHWLLDLDTPAGALQLALRLAGRHNLRNALAATASALAAGAPLAAVRDGLLAFEPVKGRSQLGRLQLGGREVVLVDDTYNANPDSVRAAIDVLAELPGPRWLVLGDMGEVGDDGPAYHAEVGRHAAERGIDCLWTAGVLARHAHEAYRAARSGAGLSDNAGPCHFPDTGSLVAQVRSGERVVPSSAAVLVKGSRFMRMEGVIAALRELQGTQGEQHAR